MRISGLLKAFMFFLPFLEIAGFIVVGGWIGVLPTLLLIIGTTVLGLLIMRANGFAMLMQIQRKMAAGQHPELDVLSGAMVMLAGLLLVIPGFITDIVGLLLLIQPVRLLILRWLITIHVIVPGPMHSKTVEHGRVINGEYKREDDK